MESSEGGVRAVGLAPSDPVGGVRAAAGFHRADALRFQRMMPGEEFAVFLGEDVVGNGGDARRLPQLAAKLEHQGRLAAADGSAHTDGEGASLEVPVERQLAIVKVSRLTVHNLRSSRRCKLATVQPPLGRLEYI
jgi:hypothetical protein